MATRPLVTIADDDDDVDGIWLQSHRQQSFSYNNNDNQDDDDACGDKASQVPQQTRTAVYCATATTKIMGRLARFAANAARPAGGNCDCAVTKWSWT
jgi:hypothetical protein